jgi:hypothetical protein
MVLDAKERISMQLTQTSTDAVDLEVFGPVTMCTFDWAGNKNGPTYLVSSDKVNRITKRRARPVDTVSKLERVMALTDEGLDMVNRFGVVDLFSRHRIFGDTHEPIRDDGSLYVFNDADAVRALLSGRSDEDITRRVFASGDGVGLFSPDSPLDSEPVNHPAFFEISNAHVDIEKAQPHLEAHPLVKVVLFHRGRPGSYDHVPSSLNVVVALPDKLRSKLEKQHREHYARYVRAGERCAASPSFFTEAFTWHLSTSPKLYGDLLGLAQFARKRDEYKDPSNEDDY